MIFIYLFLCFGFLLATSPSPRMSPDGHYYLSRPNISPYVMRGIITYRLFKFSFQTWTYVSYVAIFLTACVLEWMQLGAGFLFLGIASTRTNMVFTVLTDQLGILFLALGYALDQPLFYIFGGLVNEKTPLIGGFLNPIGWLGLIFPLVAQLKWEQPAEQGVDAEWLHKPFSTGLAKLRNTPLHELVLPWGVAGIGLVDVSPFLLLIAYLPLLLAQDRARVYQWISPIVVVSAAQLIEPQYLFALTILHFMNPWRTTL